MSEAFLIGNGTIHRLVGERGETPAYPEAKFKRGDIVRVRNLKDVTHFPRRAIIFCIVPPGFSPDWALADFVGEPRPLLHQVGFRTVRYIIGNEGDLTPYLAKERHLIATGDSVKIESVSRATAPA